MSQGERISRLTSRVHRSNWASTAASGMVSERAEKWPK